MCDSRDGVGAVAVRYGTDVIVVCMGRLNEQPPASHVPVKFPIWTSYCIAPGTGSQAMIGVSVSAGLPAPGSAGIVLPCASIIRRLSIDGVTLSKFFSNDGP